MKSKLLKKHLLSIAIFGLVLIIAFGAVINEMVIRIMFRHYENMGRGSCQIRSTRTGSVLILKRTNRISITARSWTC